MGNLDNPIEAKTGNPQDTNMDWWCQPIPIHFEQMAKRGVDLCGWSFSQSQAAHFLLMLQSLAVQILCNETEFEQTPTVALWAEVHRSQAKKTLCFTIRKRDHCRFVWTCLMVYHGSSSLSLFYVKHILRWIINWWEPRATPRIAMFFRWECLSCDEWPVPEQSEPHWTLNAKKNNYTQKSHDISSSISTRLQFQTIHGYPKFWRNSNVHQGLPSKTVLGWRVRHHSTETARKSSMSAEHRNEGNISVFVFWLLVLPLFYHVLPCSARNANQTWQLPIFQAIPIPPKTHLGSKMLETGETKR
jgi:hypothetical protein